MIGASGLSSSLKKSGEKLVDEADLDTDGGGGDVVLRLNFRFAIRLIKLV